ncbi:MAG TPA: sigma 54-interacting transcriptional regulator [Polyangiaceae bacterium]
MPREPDADAIETELARAAGGDDELVTGCTLRVAEGADRGKTFRVNPGQRVVIGQSAGCDVRLADRLASRRHAAIESLDARLRITDLDSTNGTFVNGVAVVEANLAAGEQVRIGETVLWVDTVDAPSVAESSPAASFGRVVGASFAMRRLYPVLERLAHADVPVILEGETGTGKELVAEAVHETGPRASGPFVVFDCTAVAPTLLESALFGHERGAFTGAIAARRGVFEQAQGGTLLIDEIGELDLALQPKLLRALERSEVQRVGSDGWIKIDVRVLAATRRDLDREVQEGRFRDDLLFRLAVARVELPPLRRRHGDAVLLARHFWNALGAGDRAVPPDLLARATRGSWPGNVRELRNLVARRIALGDLAAAMPEVELGTPPRAVGAAYGADDRVPGEVSASPAVATDAIEEILAQDLAFPRARDLALQEFERRYVERVLARFAGSVPRAAAAAGIARRYFQQIRSRSGTR